MTDGTPQSCAVCGQPTTGEYGVCRRAGQCASEYNRRWRAARHPLPPIGPCEICGQPVQRNNKVGICSRTRACRNAGALKRWAQDPEYGRTYRAENRERLRAASRKAARKRRAENPEREREVMRVYRQRPDRKCRYAKAGCTEFATPGDGRCPGHRKADNKRRLQRKRRKLKLRLATAQGWTCPWCLLSLPSDIHALHPNGQRAAETDHIIPKASGLIIEDEWNLQVLHWECNGTAGKGNKITLRALELAAEHGIAIPASCLAPFTPHA